jgi:hypothetical protein
MAGPQAPAPLSLTRTELKTLIELASQAPVKVVDGIRLAALFHKCVDIINSQWDLTQPGPAKVEELEDRGEVQPAAQLELPLG